MKQYKIVIYLAVFANMVNSQEIYSEAPIFIQNGHIMSDRFTIKFSENVIPTVTGEQILPVNRISQNYPELISLTQDLITTYGNIEILKQLPNAGWGDITRINNITGETITIRDLSQLFTIKFQQYIPIDSLMTLFSLLSYVDYAHQPIQIGHLASPNDSLYVSGDQWYLDAINAEQAWDITKGSSSVKIAIIDGDGVDLDHPDLTEKDSGGDSSPSGYGHGTMVAGVAAASTDNTIGIASLGWELSLLGYNIDHSNESLIVQKISDAMTAGANVINMSFVTLGTVNNRTCPVEYEDVSDQIHNAVVSGITVVASAGNGVYVGCDNGGTTPFIQHPAAHPDVIAVTATDNNPLDDFREPWNYGDFVDISAPGEYIWSTSASGYSWSRGTSFSAPLVSALAGLIISMAPTNATPEIVYDIITSTADEVGQYSYDSNGWNDHMGYGRINAYAALNLVQSLPSTPNGFYGTGGQWQNPTLHWNSVTEADIDYLELHREVIGQPGGNRIFTLSSSATQYTDNTVIINKFGFATIKYKLRAVDIINQPSQYFTNTKTYTGEGLWKQMAESIPVSFSLQGNYPNPFNPITRIRIGLPEISSVTITIYDLMGREVKTLISKTENAGFKNVMWDSKDKNGRPVSSGMYFFRIDAISKESDKEFHETKKMVLMR